MSGEYGSAAERLLERVEAQTARQAADLETTLHHAQVLATLAVAEALEGIADGLAVVFRGERP